MKTIDTLGTILTYNFGIIILFFTWFLVEPQGSNPEAADAACDHSPHTTAQLQRTRRARY